jgi:hypothetical protein
MNSFTFKSIDTLDDMINAKNYYIQMYPAQLNIYLYLYGRGEQGLFILKDKQTNQTKVLELTLNYEYVEKLLEKAKLIWQFVNNKTLPDIITDTSICIKCPYFLFCKPNIINESKLKIENNPSLLEKLQLREKLEENAKTFKEIDSEIKTIIRNLYDDGDEIVIDKYKITYKNNRITIENLNTI